MEDKTQLNPLLELANNDIEDFMLSYAVENKEFEFYLDMGNVSNKIDDNNNRAIGIECICISFEKNISKCNREDTVKYSNIKGVLILPPKRGYMILKNAFKLENLKKFCLKKNKIRVLIKKIGSNGYFIVKEWNKISDKIYNNKLKDERENN